MNLATLIVGKPGSGKTTSARDLGNDTVLLNLERKMLPFKKKGLADVPVSDIATLFKYLDNLVKRKDIKNIVIDSFSKYSDMVDKYCNASFKGYDIYKNYNLFISEFWEKIKEIEDKYIFIFGHTDVSLDADGNPSISCKVKGNEWKNIVEKEATIVFYALPIPNENGTMDYRYMTNTDGKSPSKSPMGLFEGLYIPNNLEQIIKAYDEFYDNPIQAKPRLQKSQAQNENIQNSTPTPQPVKNASGEPATTPTTQQVSQGVFDNGQVVDPF